MEEYTTFSPYPYMSHMNCNWITMMQSKQASFKCLLQHAILRTQQTVCPVPRVTWGPFYIVRNISWTNLLSGRRSLPKRYLPLLQLSLRHPTNIVEGAASSTPTRVEKFRIIWGRDVMSHRSVVQVYNGGR